jgi:hypothetical protein
VRWGGLVSEIKYGVMGEWSREKRDNERCGIVVDAPVCYHGY